MTKRRTVLAGIAAALALGPLAAQAQPQGGMRRLGALIGSLASDPNWQARAAVFVQGLGTLGWLEGTNLRIDCAGRAATRRSTSATRRNSCRSAPTYSCARAARLSWRCGGRQARSRSSS